MRKQENLERERGREKSILNKEKVLLGNNNKEKEGTEREKERKREREKETK